MRLLKYNESYKKNYSSIENTIKYIWGLTEDDIFEVFNDLHDDIQDVDIELVFYIKGKNGQYILDRQHSNLEVIEAYASIGYKPCITINFGSNTVTILNDEMLRIQSYVMEAIYNIEDYSIFSSKSGYGYFQISLEFNEDSYKVKSLYHKKTLSSFEPIFKYFKENSYNVTFSRIFVSEKSGGMLLYTPGSKKVYQIIISKELRLGGLDIIDEMATAKSRILSMTDSILDIDDMDYFFDIGTADDRSKKGLICIKFIVNLYEK
jgi:hypothetical protein